MFDKIINVNETENNLAELTDKYQIIIIITIIYYAQRQHITQHHNYKGRKNTIN